MADLKAAQVNRTWRSGPSDPASIADGPGLAVAVRVKAEPETMWPLVQDISLPARFSEEFMGARWADGSTEPALGARFIGTNSHELIGDWQVDCFVNRFLAGQEFGWVTSDPDNPGAQWCFEIFPGQGSSDLRHSLTLGPGPSGLTAAIQQRPEKASRIIERRLDELAKNMKRVVEGIRDIAESQ